MNNETELRFAILIDADNISEKYVKLVLEEVANSGVATYKRIYGDWTSSRLARWKSCLLENSIIPMQQYSYTFGKNATDSAMIIDAMDILYSGTVDGFAIVSSDSDFTRLVARLRESGMIVIGMGEQKTPRPFISACNQFKYLDLLYAARKAEEELSEEEDDAEPEGAPRKRRRGRRGGRRNRAKLEPIADQTPLDGPHPDEALEHGELEGAAVENQDREDSADSSDALHRPRRRPGDRGAGVPDALAVENDEPHGSALAHGADIEFEFDVESDADADADFEPEFDEQDTEFDYCEMSKADRRRHMRMIRETINAIIDKFSDDDGWVSLGQLGDQLGKRLPDFDVRNYGFKKLRPFLKSLGVYEFDEPASDSGKRQIYLRLRLD